MFRLLAFDFDGTIADTLGEMRCIYNELAADYGARQVEEEEMERLRQLSLPELIVDLGVPAHRVPSLVTRGTGRLRGRIERIELIEGIREVLQTLKGRVDHLGILTSNSSDNVERFLEVHQLGGLFEFISSKSSLTGKSRHLKAILTTFSLKPHEMLYIGDELRDVKASQKAGIPVAAVSWGFNAHEALAQAKPDFLFDAPQQLLELMGKD
ncbi:MAG TPA: HAD-IA family hydrolase [Luteolibacter sp.]|nr:HAD-IA family hydrolase [Luteolibacter sp.]